MNLQWMTDYTFQWIFGTALTSLFTYVVTTNRQRKQKEIESNNRTLAVEGGLKALLRDRLLSLIHKGKKQGYLYVHERDSIYSMYDEYRKLGGNSTVTQLMDEVSKIPTKTDIN